MTSKYASKAVAQPMYASRVAQRIVGGPLVPPGPEIVLAAKYGLVSAWNMNEASGTRNDAYGSNHLTDNNTVTTATAKVGAFAAQFVAANVEFLSIADNASLSTGDVDFWMAAWVYHDSVGATDQTLFAKGSGFASGGEYLLRKNDSDQFLLDVRKADNSGSVNLTFTATPVLAATWYFVMAYHDSVLDTVNLSVNGSAFISDALVGGVFDGANDFQIGRRGAAGDNLNGRIDAAVFGKSPPTGIAAVAVELRDYIYNAGAGREYPGGWT